MENNQQKTVPDIVQTVMIEAPIQKVWEVVSTAEGIAAWFMPNDFKAEAGYDFHLQSPFGPSPCKVIEINAPNQLSFLWDTEGWVVTFSLKELDGGTEFTVTHGGWKHPDFKMAKANEKSIVIRDRMNGGWAGIVQKLKKAVES